MSNNNLQPNWIVDFVKDKLGKLSPAYGLTAIFLLVLLGLFPAQKLLDGNQTEPPLPITVSTQYNGRADYIRLEINMNLATVESILGRGNEIEQSETTRTFTWENLDGSSINVVFKDGQLETKSQSKLK